MLKIPGICVAVIQLLVSWAQLLISWTTTSISVEAMLPISFIAAMDEYVA